jgi:hypothetical protein
VDDHDLVHHITQLVDEEHQLRGHLRAGAGVTDEDRERMAKIEVQLDQCWDLLRRRQAREEYGLDPDSETERDAPTVEGYRQ